MIDLVGQKFGYLTVIADSGDRDPKRGVVWRCQCDCGNVKLVATSYLRSGGVRSCGCFLRQEMERRSREADLTGRKVGRLTVLRRLSDLKRYECLCDCGVTTVVNRNNLRQGVTRSCGCLQRELAAELFTTHGMSDSTEAKLLWASVGRARKRRVPHTITLDDIRIPDVCPALGTPLAVGVGQRTPDSPTLDRLRPDRGYVPGNVLVISHRANLIKNSATSAQVRAVGEWMRAHDL